jgi:chromosome segregation and condensation protein ScpB
MLTREEITEIYEGDPKALISLIQNLEKRMEEQNVKITELEQQVKILKSHCLGDYKK